MLIVNKYILNSITFLIQLLSKMERRRANEDRQCKLCAFHTYKMDSLKIHIETIHKILAFVCSDCDFKTTRKCNLDHKYEAFSN